MAKMTRARFLEALHCAERRIAAGTERIEKQRRVIARLEERGDTITAAAARTALATIEQAQRGHIADRDRIKRLRTRSG
jgi:hypothetical protein